MSGSGHTTPQSPIDLFEVTQTGLDTSQRLLEERDGLALLDRRAVSVVGVHDRASPVHRCDLRVMATAIAAFATVSEDGALELTEADDDGAVEVEDDRALPLQ